jgi:glutathione-specific gamma-glutamylcyclotransferase
MQNDFWVFGYGSLMWRPGFVFTARHKAVVHGWRRRLCIYSTVYRGAPERPGILLGLDAGGECTGVAFQVSANLREPTLRNLRERELISDVYDEKTVPAHLESGERVAALTYVANRHHPEYAAPMAREQLLALVRQGRGESGDNSEYVLNTRNHLRGIGIVDPELEWLAGRLSEA